MTPRFPVLALAACLLALGLPAAAQSPADPLTCLLAPDRVSDIGSDTAGIVRDVPVSRADFVEAGALLVQIDDQMAQSDVAIARINMEALAARIDRSEGLRQRNLITRDEIEAMQTEYALAEAEAARAELQVARSRIVAPFAGYVAQVSVSEGELTGAEPLMQLIDVTTLKAELVMVDAAYGMFSVGDTLDLVIDITGAEVSAVITAIDPFLDASSNTFSMQAEIDNADLSLPAGSSCRRAS